MGVKKYIFILLCLALLAFLVSSSALAQKDPQAIKAEIERHRQAIKQLKEELRSMRADAGYNQEDLGESIEEGPTGEDYGSSAGAEEQGVGQQGLLDKANVDRPWEKAADANKDGVVDKTEIGQWKDRGGPGKGPRPEGMPPKRDFDKNPPGPKGGPGAGGPKPKANPPGPKGGQGAGPRGGGKGPGPR